LAPADVGDAACQGCHINISMQMYSAIEGSNDICIFENCGNSQAGAKRKNK
jgi:predicted  nucleic acid-binding Zn-ribbon protein